MLWHESESCSLAACPFKSEVELVFEKLWWREILHIQAYEKLLHLGIGVEFSKKHFASDLLGAAVG